MSIAAALQKTTQIIRQGQETEREQNKAGSRPLTKFSHLGRSYRLGGMQVYNGIMRGVEPCEICSRSVQWDGLGCCMTMGVMCRLITACFTLLKQGARWVICLWSRSLNLMKGV